MEDLPLHELLETLLGPEVKRRLRLKCMGNDYPVQLYNSELARSRHPEDWLDIRLGGEAIPLKTAELLFFPLPVSSLETISYQ